MPAQVLQPGDMGVLQYMNRSGLNGLVAEVTGGLKRRMLYSLVDPADSEICLAYKVSVPGHPRVHERIEWCVKQHQIRRIDDPDLNQQLAHKKSRRTPLVR